MYCQESCPESLTILSPSLDLAVAEYIEHLYQEGDTVGMASNTLAALQYFQPDCLGKLKYSWKLTGLWRRMSRLVK